MPTQTFRCADCGKEFPCNSPRQLRCVECAIKHHRERCRINHANRQKKISVQKDMASKPKPTVTLAQASVEATRAGLTYGKWVERYERGKVHEQA